MLKKITPDELRIGMFIQSFEGSWLEHPFWRNRFALNDSADLRAIRASGIPFCWIDVSRGLDVATPAADEAAAPVRRAAPGDAVAANAESAADARPDAPRAELESELQRAAAVIDRSRAVIGSLFREARLGNAIDVEKGEPLVDEIAKSVARNPGALISLARLKRRDDYTFMHSVAVCALMVGLARQLGWDEARTREAGMAGLLHDVGKMAMPDEVLNKAGALTDAEFAIMRSHPVRGHEILSESEKVPDAALDVCLHHHEKIDGTGYPYKLPGERLSELARMGAVCDVYDAITSNRPYKEAWDPGSSIRRMAQWKGHFDPAIFKLFVRTVGIYPVGTLVRMASQRLGVVVECNESQLAAPRVRTFFSTRTKLPVPTQLVDLASPGCTDRIVGVEEAAAWGFSAQTLEELWSSANR